MKPFATDLLGIGTNDMAVANSVASEAEAQMGNYCGYAHFGVLAEKLFPGIGRPSLEWQQNARDIALRWNNVTTFLDGMDLQLGGWGLYKEVPGQTARSYASNAWQPIPTICNEGEDGPFGIASVATFSAPASVSNPPMPGTGRIAPRQSATLDAGSSGLLTVTGSSPRTLDLSGSLEIESLSCSSQSCRVSLSGMEVTAAPFNFEGYAIRHLRLTARDAATGALQGNTLAFDGFAGQFEVRLDDGRYDFVPVTTGVLLANWDSTAHRFVVAFSFSAELSDGTMIDLSGSAFGRIVNISPLATIRIANPVPSSVGVEQATLECMAPEGTTVDLDGSQSTDSEDSAVNLAWHVNGTQESTTSAITLPNLALGTTTVALMATDTLGFAANDRLTLQIVDTLAPSIAASDQCLFPPNHSTVLLRIGQELDISALDQCSGPVEGSIRIVDVTSSSGAGVVRWGANEVCLVAERSGQEAGGRVYDVKVEATDSSGNAATHTVHVRIPHNHTQDCVNTKVLSPC